MQNDEYILVVDDEWWIRAFIRVALEELGFAVVEAQDADTALAMMDALPVRMLVTDPNLGAGPDGLALAAAARRRCPNLQVLYVSGDPDRFRQRVLAEWEWLVPKPFSLETVVKVVVEMAAPAVGDRANPNLRAAEKLQWVPPSDTSPTHRAA